MDFDLARTNMVEQQIRPGGVLDVDILNVLEEIPRERFVSEAQKSVAYVDLQLPLANGSVMLPPLTVGRMVQALQIKSTDKVLEIGTGSGYATALLSKLAHSVITMDTDRDQLHKARAVLSEIGYTNIAFEAGNGFTDAQSFAPFDVIYVGGACKKLPETLKALITPNTGKIIVTEGELPVLKVNLYQFIDGVLVGKTVFETNMPYLDHSTSSTSFEF